MDAQQNVPHATVDYAQGIVPVITGAGIIHHMEVAMQLNVQTAKVFLRFSQIS